MAPKKNTSNRVTMDVSAIIAEIDQYPEKAGIDPALWAEMSYPQKCLYLTKRGLRAAQVNLDEFED